LSSRRPASKVATPVPVPPEDKLENGSNAQRNSVVLGPRDRLVGQLYIEGDLRVSGIVDGSLEATGDIEIAGRGKVSGAVTAYNRLVVGSDASLIGGDVRVARLTVEDGATFTGRVSMGQHQATVPAEPEPVAEQPRAASARPTTDDFGTPRASVGWSKRRKGR
jgi:cytoskeletal protein CcmA (bactofilin family)